MVNFVEAIEDGKIVKVTEEYAKAEGLLIVRKQDDSASYGYVGSEVKSSHGIGGRERAAPAAAPFAIKRRESFTLDKMRKPLHYYKNDVMADLVDNFHWQISSVRKSLNMNRKQLAQKVGESENTIKMVENGILPNDNYILINKIQSVLGINLRKDSKKYDTPKIDRTLAAAKSPRWARPEEKPFVSEEPKEEAATEGEESEDVLGGDIEVFDD